MDGHLKLHFLISDLNFHLIIYESFFRLFFKGLVFYYLSRSASTCSVHIQEINPLSRSAIKLSYFSCFQIKENDSLIKIFAFSSFRHANARPLYKRRSYLFSTSTITFELFSYLWDLLLIIYISYQKLVHFSVFRSKNASFSSFSLGSEMIAL